MAILGDHASGDASRPSGPGLAQPLASSHNQTTFGDSLAAVREKNLDLYLARLLFAARRLANDRIKSSRSRPTEEPIEYCEECQHASLSGTLTHAASCRTGEVLDVLAAICAPGLAESAEAAPEAELQAGPEVASAQTDAELAAAVDAAIDAGPEMVSGGEFGEPWGIDYGPTDVYVADVEGYPIGSMHGGPLNPHEYAERVAACVNFCEGIATELLQAEKPLADMSRDINQVIAVRRVLPGLPELAKNAEVRR